MAKGHADARRGRGPGGSGTCLPLRPSASRDGPRAVYSPRVLLEGGGGASGTQKSKTLCAKNCQINISFCTISFFPTMKSGLQGGEGLDPPPQEVLNC